MLSTKLKESTKELHEIIEKNPHAKKIEERSLTLASYITMLEAYYLIHKTLEPQLQKYEALDFSKKARLAHLRDDLKELGYLEEDFQKLDKKELFFSLHSFEEALGVVYVLEGSRMGGMIIAQILEKLLGSTKALRYFSGYKEQTVPLFLAFKSSIDVLECDEQKVIKGAKRCFGFMNEVLNSAL